MGGDPERGNRTATDAPTTLEAEHARAQRGAALWMTAIGIVSCALSYLFDEPAVARANAVVALLLTANLFVLRRGLITLGSLFGVIIIAGFVLWVAPITGVRSYFWLHVLPPIAYFMLGARHGTWVTAGIGVVLAVELACFDLYASKLTKLDVAFSFLAATLIANVATRARTAYQTALARASLTDALTGLANRRSCELAIRREAQLAARSARTASVVLFDVDGFKSINDRFGHAAGDEVLRELATILRDDCARQSDLVGRWGGEELVCLLPGTDREGARCFAERARQRVRAHTFFGIGQVTVSAGVAQFTPPKKGDAPVLTWLARADEALYQAKNQGRDLVVLSPAPPDALSPTLSATPG